MEAFDDLRIAAASAVSTGVNFNDTNSNMAAVMNAEIPPIRDALSNIINAFRRIQSSLQFVKDAMEEMETAMQDVNQAITVNLLESSAMSETIECIKEAAKVLNDAILLTSCIKIDTDEFLDAIRLLTREGNGTRNAEPFLTSGAAPTCPIPTCIGGNVATVDNVDNIAPMEQACVNFVPGCNQQATIMCPSGERPICPMAASQFSVCPPTCLETNEPACPMVPTDPTCPVRANAMTAVAATCANMATPVCRVVPNPPLPPSFQRADIILSETMILPAMFDAIGLMGRFNINMAVANTAMGQINSELDKAVRQFMRGNTFDVTNAKDDLNDATTSLGAAATAMANACGDVEDIVNSLTRARDSLPLQNIGRKRREAITWSNRSLEEATISPASKSEAQGKIMPSPPIRY